MDKLLKLSKFATRKEHRPQPVFKFFNKPLYLVRSGKEIQENEVCFRCKQELTKPEIRQILTKLYGLDVKKVKTWNKMGKIQKSNLSRQYFRKPDFKKVIVELNNPVPPSLQNFIY